MIEVERDWPRLISPSLSAGAPAFWLRCFQLRSGLLPVANRVVGAEWNLLASWQQEFLAALHQVLLIECPRIHEILEHDHDHVLRNVSDSQTFGNSARLA